MVLDYRTPGSEWEAMHRPTWAEISLDAIAANTRLLRDLAAPADLMAVVKADAYGHGAAESARATLEAGATWLGVAALEEAIELRRAGITAPILTLTAATPAQAEVFVRNDITAAVYEVEVAEALAAAGRRAGRPARAHFKVDTGMGRLGAMADRAGLELASRLSRLEGLKLDGAYSHFSASDEADLSFAYRQARLFDQFVAAAEREGLRFAWRHIANSAGLINLPETRHNLVRVGIALYGLYPSDDVDKSLVVLAPAMSWKARLVHVKKVPAGTPISYGGEYVTDHPTVVGTLAVGYADGYRRTMKGRVRVLVRGRSCPVLGRICMDHIMVDLDAAPGAEVGDEAVLLGYQDGAYVPAEELAAACQSNNYEIVSAVGRRMPRVFVKNGRPVALRSILGTAPIGVAPIGPTPPGGGPA